jgi:hypothetical protein
LGVIVIPVVRIITPGICERSTKENPVIVKSTVVEPAIVKSIPVEPTAVEPAKSGMDAAPVEPAATAVKSTHSAAVETPATASAMWPSIGEIWLAERRCAQQSRCDCQSPSYPGPGPTFD